MPNPKKTVARKPSWSAARKNLETWDKAALLALMKDLFEANAENRDFINARCQPEEDGGEALETYRRKILEQFFPDRGIGKANLSAVKKAIRDYRKATKSIPGLAELLMTYVENAARYTSSYGDIDENFYTRVESALRDLAELLRGKARELYPRFRNRLANLVTLTEGIGWGFHDTIVETIEELKDELGEA